MRLRPERARQRRADLTLTWQVAWHNGFPETFGFALHTWIRCVFACGQDKEDLDEHCWLGTHHTKILPGGNVLKVELPYLTWQTEFNGHNIPFAFPNANVQQFGIEKRVWCTNCLDASSPSKKLDGRLWTATDRFYCFLTKKTTLWPQRAREGRAKNIVLVYDKTDRMQLRFLALDTVPPTGRPRYLPQNFSYLDWTTSEPWFVPYGMTLVTVGVRQRRLSHKVWLNEALGHRPLTINWKLVLHFVLIMRGEGIQRILRWTPGRCQIARYFRYNWVTKFMFSCNFVNWEYFRFINRFQRRTQPKT